MPVSTVSIPANLEPLVSAIKTVTGKRVHVATAIRWVTVGRANIRLKAWRLGGRHMTDCDSVRDFVEAVTIAKNGPPPLPTLPKTRSAATVQRDADWKERELEAAGA